MDICLLCDEPMHEKPDSGTTLDDLKKYKHKEHIIQNAIGGRLKSSTILCESCGGILNREIDIDFQKLFLLITGRINNLAKDRNANANTKLQGIHVDTKKAVKFVDKIPVPLKPTVKIIDAEEKVIIYCPKDFIHNFRKSVIKDLKADKKEHYFIEEITEFHQNDHVWLSFSKDVENFNDKWKMGFIKIATEFAYMNGVPKDQLIKTLDKKNKKLIFSDNIYPFVPVTAIDHFLEYNKNIIEKNYPTHTLHLYTQAYNKHDKQLICYVELFSTFQYYVLLTDKYTGPEIMQSYCQKLVTEEKFNLNIKGLRPKELMSEAERFGINLKNSYSSSIEDTYAYFEKEYAKIQPVYELDLKKELKTSLNLVSMSILQARMSVTLQLTGIDTELIEFIKKFPEEYIKKLSLEILYFFDNNEDIIIERFRKLYPKTNNKGEVAYISMVAKCLHIADENMQRINDYGHEKFSFLSYFLNVQQNIRN